MIKTFTTPPFYKHLLVVFIQTKLGNDAVFTAFTIRHFVISVAAVTAGIFFIKRILYCIVLSTDYFVFPINEYNIHIYSYPSSNDLQFILMWTHAHVCLRTG